MPVPTMKKRNSDPDMDADRDVDNDSLDDDESVPLLGAGEDGGHQGRGGLRHRQQQAANRTTKYKSDGATSIASDAISSSSGIDPVTGTFRPVLGDSRTKGDPAFVPEQFRRRDECFGDSASGFHRRVPVPWGSVCLGAFLLVCGLVSLLNLASDVYTGYDNEDEEEAAFKLKWKDVDDDSVWKPSFIRRSERFWPLLFLGTVAFIPGAYVSTIAVLSALGVAGYSFEDIP